MAPEIRVQFIGNACTAGHTIYTIKVIRGDHTWNLHKRYREIRELHEELRLRLGDALPPFPAKRLFGHLDPNFIQTRQAGLQTYLDGVLQNHASSGRSIEKVLEEWLQCPPPSTTPQTQVDIEVQNMAEHLEGQLLNLALPPSPLDEVEITARVKKYGQVMKLHVLSQPVDPIHLRRPDFDLEPVQLSSGNNLETLRLPPHVDQADIDHLLETFTKCKKAVTTIPDDVKEDDMVVAFPNLT
mmetsp:Transcript_62229/g.131529  ORF Transcript_62229/g.131529 Transcript_62229/m.131529 type:complete len:241 (-) Transcript_62229:112-834(-)|eukprot:CAMPEP_0206473518 /NCGR_PEP_ID=MMETSP0324_2-20121206/32909_1 /ASSEMBLY_ACC=CAM_ASM_000836 /TAXON_ID=2866 /ORGANISM="Crypthecodinium cohnii, Strain Seligo" /LENGTH=240 /DNA_ID=CAMNT_0053948455 /DNA_START=133 /DNA_END=855 /DNA_ORIENTATION=+